MTKRNRTGRAMNDASTPQMTTPPANLAHALADRYRFERERGAGGMATVYLAHDLRGSTRPTRTP